jgi:hypothetical protein
MDMNPPSINSVDHGFGFQWIHAVGVMNLGPVQGRVEHTGHDHDETPAPPRSAIKKF